MELYFWRRVRLGAVLLLLSGFAGGPPSAAAAPQITCATAAASEREAAAMAKNCGQVVEVAAATTERSRLTVKPSGVFVLEQHVTPVRVRRGTAWTPVDTVLRRQPDGSLAPGATTVGLRFSRGGDDPLVTFTVGGGSVVLSWPAALPPAVADGDTAVYPEVFAGVDLRVRATAAGFSQVLVVKSRAAAAGPALAAIRYRVSSSGGLAVKGRADGAVEVLAGTRVVASAPPAMMWDSTGAPAQDAGAQAARVQTEPPLTETPADTSRTAPVRAEITGTDLVVTPDHRLLTAPDATYPLYVDPAFSARQLKWAYSNDNGNERNDGIARVGNNPDGSGRYRAYFHFELEPIARKQIVSATFATTLIHSSSCSDTPVSLYDTDDIPDWAANGDRVPFSIAMYSHLDERWGKANKTSCSQPDQRLEFTGRLREKVQEWVNIPWTYTALALSTRRQDGSGEHDLPSWKKFKPEESSLSIEYNTNPYTPSAAQLSTHAEYTAPAQACVTGSSRPFNRSLTPYLKAHLTDPDGVNGPGSGYLSGTFAVERWNGSAWTVLSGWPKTVFSVRPDSKAEIQIMSGLAEADVVRWRVTAEDAGGLLSGWSPWCEFTVNAVAPSVKPMIGTADGVYREKIFQPNPQGSIGKSGMFTFTANGVVDVQKYVYRFDNGPEITVTAVNSAGQPTLGGSATVTVTPSHAGENVLTVRSVDQGGNSSANRDYGFIVAHLSGPAAHWAMNEASGSTLTSAIPGGPSATLLNGPTRSAGRLHGTHEVNGAERAVAFDGVDDRATASSAIIDTSRSFSVAAWARIDADVTTGERAIVAKSGNWAESFYLTYTAGCACWEVRIPSTTDNTTITWWVGRSTSPVRLGVWTHLAATYDPAVKSAKLFVNGVLEATVTGVAAVNAPAGELRIGWSAGGQWKGRLDDVRVWDRTLDPAVDLTPIVAPVKVGAWDFETCEGNVATDKSKYGHHGTFSHNPEDPASPIRWTEGHDYSCGVFMDRAGGIRTTGPVLHTDESFTVSAWVRLDDDDPSDPDPDLPNGNKTVLGQSGSKVSGFYLGYRHSTTTPRWGFVLCEADVTGGDDPATPVGGNGLMASTVLTTADLGRWFHLVATFDAHSRAMRLYVNGVPAGSGTRQIPMFDTAGPMTFGSALWSSPPAGTPGQVDVWRGAFDKVTVYQGAVSPGAVGQIP